MSEPELKAPERLWAQVIRDGSYFAYDYDPREAHDNGKPVYVYVPESRLDEVRRALSAALSAIKSLPEGALGRDPQEGHFYRDELIYNIDKVLKPNESEERDG